MTHCHSTAYIVVDGREVGMLACELEAGHHDDRRLHPLGGIIDEVDYPEAMREYDARVIDPSQRQDAWPIYPGTPHAHTLTWADVTTEDIDEVYDPDESFDLEVDIAPAEVIEHQARVTADAESVEPRSRTCEHCGSLLGLAGGVWRHPDADLVDACPVGNVVA